MENSTPLPMAEAQQQLLPPQGQIPWAPLPVMPTLMKGMVNGEPCVFVTIHTQFGALTWAWNHAGTEAFENMLREARGALQIASAGPNGLFIPGA